jgi:hypothetical protein
MLYAMARWPTCARRSSSSSAKPSRSWISKGGAVQGSQWTLPARGELPAPYIRTRSRLASGEEFVCHAGHEFNYLADCRLVIEVGTQWFELKPGDTLTFPATTPHRLSNPWAETAELVRVFVSSSGPRTAVTI